jgi:hypothetical protein
MVACGAAFTAAAFFAGAAAFFVGAAFFARVGALTAEAAAFFTTGAFVFAGGISISFRRLQTATWSTSADSDNIGDQMSA